MAPFSYSHLPLTEREIRVLKLLPARDEAYDSPLEAEITKVSLDDCPAFAALSWVWGSTDNKCDIFLSIPASVDDANQGSLSITHNLSIALRRLRQVAAAQVAGQGGEDRLSASLPLWTDQICINQNDDDEKSRQIPLMADIYGFSEMTIGWLGEALDTTTAQVAMTHLRELGHDGMQIGLDKISPQQYRMLCSAGVSDDESTFIPTEEDDIASAKLFAAIRGRPHPWELDANEPILKLCALPYFTRGWIQQEVAIPRRIVFQWSTATIDGDLLGAAILFLQLHVHYSLGAVRRMIASTPEGHKDAMSRTISRVLCDFIPLDRFVAPCISIRRQYQVDRSARFFNLTFLLRKYKHLSFGEHKDRVWGLLGLANDADKLREKVDVRLTWQDVFVQAARLCICNPVERDDWLGGMNVLALAGYKTRAPPSTGIHTRRILPSWVPDYRSLPTSLTIAEQTFLFLDRPFRASPVLQTVAAEIEAQAEGADKMSHNHILNVRGTVVDRVLKLGPLPSPWAARNGINKDLIRQPLVALQDLADEACMIVSSSKAISRHPFRDNLPRLAEAAWRVPILDSEFVTSPTTCRRATSLSKACHQAYLAESPDAHGMTAQQVMDYEEQLYAFGSRSAFLGEQGFVGMGSPWIREGDVLVVLDGAMVPFIFRQIDGTEHFTVISEAFCDGLMDEEVMEIGPAQNLSIV